MLTSVQNRGHGRCILRVEFRNEVLNLFHNILTMNTVLLTVKTLPLNFKRNVSLFPNYSDSLNSVFISYKKSLAGFSVVTFH
jgi:hypothetical protein